MAIDREDPSGSGSNPLVGQPSAQLLPPPPKVGGLASTVSRGLAVGPGLRTGLGVGWGWGAGPDTAPALLRSQ